MTTNKEFPFLSIIIATRNAAADLRATLEAISAQQCAAVEVLVQDACSTDNTVSVAAEYIPARLSGSVISEQDNGIYDAWNKALERISGEWVLFMGAGDTFCGAHALADVLAALQALPRHCEYYSVPVRSVFPPDEPLEIMAPALHPLHELPQGMCLPHQGLFHRRELFVRNRFDAAFRVAGDYEFICRTLTQENIRRGKTPYVRMLFGGLSSNMRYMPLREKEFWQISRRYFPQAVPWKIAARAMRSALYVALDRLCGQAAAGYFADIPRRLKGKPPLWTRALPPEKPLPPLPASPRIDLLVATLGRREELRRLLESLRVQRFRDFRVILADQNPTEYLRDMLSEFSELDITVRHMEPCGVSAARNALFADIQGDIIAFPDDDCWYDENTLACLVKIFQNDANIGGVLGVHAEIQTKARPPRQLAHLDCFFHSETYLQFFRREVTTSVGEFDAQLGPGTGLPYGCGEDTDYLLRAYATCHKIIRSSAAHIHHPLVNLRREHSTKTINYAQGRMYLLRKHHMPLWFTLCNIAYPLLQCMPALLRGDKMQLSYRWCMFHGRLKGWLSPE